MRSERVVVIGGGTGNFAVLSGLKQRFTHITALVNMADDGGSTGVLRDELGVLPPGDVRQCLVALSQAPEVRDLFSYRFQDGTLRGHSFGNLFLSTMEKVTGSFPDAVKLASQILRIRGAVLPITTNNVRLVMTHHDGQKVTGEFVIGTMDFGSTIRPELSLEPAAHITSDAVQAIADADMVVIAPGNLYASLAPALIVGGVREALAKTSAPLVYICNLVTKPRQTDGFDVADYAAEIERFIGEQALDYVIYNNEQPAPDMLRKYTHQGEFLVKVDSQRLQQAHYQAIGLPLIASDQVTVSVKDPLFHSRSLIRHDSAQITAEIERLLDELNIKN